MHKLDFLLCNFEFDSFKGINKRALFVMLNPLQNELEWMGVIIIQFGILH
jgi:hypothetical protein